MDKIKEKNYCLLQWGFTFFVNKLSDINKTKLGCENDIAPKCLVFLGILFFTTTSAVNVVVKINPSPLCQLTKLLNQVFNQHLSG